MLKKMKLTSVEYSRNLRKQRSKPSLGLQGKDADNKDQEDHANSSRVVFPWNWSENNDQCRAIGLQEHDEVRTNNEDKKESRFKT